MNKMQELIEYLRDNKYTFYINKNEDVFVSHGINGIRARIVDVEDERVSKQKVKDAIEKHQYDRGDYEDCMAINVNDLKEELEL